MKIEDKLKNEFGRETGFRVPDGYFDEVFDRISASLPEHSRKPAPQLTRWQRVRPYIYLAAMFAGIWCMMKMFHMMTSSPEVSLDNPPALVADAIVNSENEVLSTMISLPAEQVIESDIESQYDNFDEFEEDFDYEFEDEYADIDINELVAELGSDPTDQLVSDLGNAAAEL